MPSAHDDFQQLMELPLVITPEIASGKIFVVTGGNGGLGYEAIKHLVSMGAATVVMAVRTISKGEIAQQQIETTTGRKGVIQVWQLDKTSFDSVKAFATKIINELDHVDSFIDNAGVAQSSPNMPEGHNENMTVNTYSSILMAILLLPSMSKHATKGATTSRITLVSSGASFFAQESWNKIKDRDDILAAIDDVDIMPTLHAYPISKAVQIMATKHLTEKVPVSRTGVILNLVDPGICKTSLSRNAPPAFKKELEETQERVGRTAETGSRTLLHGAIAGEDSHGCLLDACTINEGRIPAWINGTEAKVYQKKLWEGIAKQLETVSPGCINAIL